LLAKEKPVKEVQKRVQKDSRVISHESQQLVSTFNIAGGPCDMLGHIQDKLMVISRRVGV
jgi:hypothetical protein